MCDLYLWGAPRPWKMALGNIPFWQHEQCHHRLRGASGKRTVCNSGGRKRVWSCGKESIQDAVLQGKGGTGCHRGKEVGELEELGKALLDLPILVVGESLGEFDKA